MLAVSYLRGRAQHWFKPTLRKYLDDDEDEESLFTDFGNFKKEIRRVFGETNETMAAVRIIQHLKQRTSASDYTARFEEYSQLSGWDDEALMTMYRRGLKDNVKDELMRDGRVIDSLDELTKAAIEIDNKLYERAMERKYDGENRGRAGFVSDRPPSNYYRKGGNRSDQGNANRSQYGPAPMELDSTERKTRKGHTRRGKQGNNGKETRTCYGCGKPGHLAKNCRSKVQRQLNVITRCDEPEGYDQVEGLDVRAPWDYDADEESDWSWTEEEAQEYEQLQLDNAEARKDRVQRTNSSEHRELTPYPREVCQERRQPSYERPRPSDTPDTMKLGHILESNTIEDVTDTIEEMLGSSAATEKVIPDKLRIRGRQLKVEISKNSDDELELGNTPQIPCDKDDYVDCHYDLCNTHIQEKISYLHFPRGWMKSAHDKLQAEECTDQYCLYHFSEKPDYWESDKKGGYQRYTDNPILTGVELPSMRDCLNIAFTRKHHQRKEMLRHGSLNWTVCTDDSCMLHIHEKDGAGYYPTNSRKPKRQGKD